MAVDDRSEVTRWEDEVQTVCAICGNEVDGGDIEDTAGWRWYSDGAGGLIPVCRQCTVPDDPEAFERLLLERGRRG
jgi:hypothetical protein